MGKADALSRMTGLETGENDNKDIVLLKPELFSLLQSLEFPEDDIIREIKKHEKAIHDLSKEDKFYGFKYKNGLYH